jgi:hypothetical protein
MQDQAKPDTLSGAQLQTLQRSYQDELKKISHRMELRDRALDQACGLVKTVGNASSDAIGLAEKMFAFLTADLPPALPAPDRQTPA